MKTRELAFLAFLANVFLVNLLLRSFGDRYLILYFFRSSHDAVATTALYVLSAVAACALCHLYLERVRRWRPDLLVAAIYAATSAMAVLFGSMLATFVGYIVLTGETYLLEPLARAVVDTACRNSKYWLLLAVANTGLYWIFNRAAARPADGGADIA